MTVCEQEQLRDAFYRRNDIEQTCPIKRYYLRGPAASAHRGIHVRAHVFASANCPFFFSAHAYTPRALPLPHLQETRRLHQDRHMMRNDLVSALLLSDVTERHRWEGMLVLR